MRKILLFILCLQFFPVFAQEQKQAKDLEVLMTKLMLQEVGMDKNFIPCFAITSGRNVLLSTPTSFYLLGWGGIAPYGKQKKGNIASFAYTSDSLLFIVRNNELCLIDSTDQLQKVLSLPSSGMGIASGNDKMYLYDRVEGLPSYSIFTLQKGGKYLKLVDLPQKINSVCEVKGKLFLTNSNKLYQLDVEQKKLDLMYTLENNEEIISITYDPLNDCIYFSTPKVIYGIKDEKVYALVDQMGGIISFFDKGLMIFNPAVNALLRFPL